MKTAKKSILLFGDTIVDVDIEAEATGLSLESPTLKASYISQRRILGGAANVAYHLNHLGAEVTFVTDLPESDCEPLSARGIKIISLNSGISNIKTRYWITRADARYKYLQINQTGLSPAASDDLQIEDIFSKATFDHVVVSDYRCGLISRELCNMIAQSGISCFGASQMSDKAANFDWFSGFDIIVCNEEEAKFIPQNISVCITLGENGCFFEGQNFPSRKLDISSAIGAGDAFLAAFVFSRDPLFANNFATKFLSGQIGENNG